MQFVSPYARATRHEAIVRPARLRRRAALVLALGMDVLAATALQGETSSSGYLVVAFMLLANAWLCCAGTDRVVVTVGDDGIASGRTFMPFSAIESIVTPFRRPGYLLVRLAGGDELGYVPTGRGDGVDLRTRMMQQFAAYRHAAGAARPISFDAITGARGAGYRRPEVTPALWSVLESPGAPPLHRARAALELERRPERSAPDLLRMHAAAASTAHPILRKLLLSCAGHATLSPRARARLLRALRA
ncbi:MAG TPA: hypothetical protein VGH28_04455 [Polyangiaceae bacterium]|jgi:hypothetical protein